MESRVALVLSAVAAAVCCVILAGTMAVRRRHGIPLGRGPYFLGFGVLVLAWTLWLAFR